MRYFFTFMGVMIVWRSFSWLRKDRRQKHRRLKQLPDAGTIGIFTVLQGGKQIKQGDLLSVPHEGVLGYLRTCDVVVPMDDVATIHLDFTFQDGKGLFIYPRRGCEAVVDGVPLTSRRVSSRNPMQHGSTLQVGHALLQLGVFAGLNVQEAQQIAYVPEPPEDWQELQPVQPPYAPYPYEEPNLGQQSAQPPYAQQPAHSPYAPPYHPLNTQWPGGDENAP